MSNKTHGISRQPLFSGITVLIILISSFGQGTSVTGRHINLPCFSPKGYFCPFFISSLGLHIGGLGLIGALLGISLYETEHEQIQEVFLLEPGETPLTREGSIATMELSNTSGMNFNYGKKSPNITSSQKMPKVSRIKLVEKSQTSGRKKNQLISEASRSRSMSNALPRHPNTFRKREQQNRRSRRWVTTEKSSIATNPTRRKATPASTSDYALNEDLPQNVSPTRDKFAGLTAPSQQPDKLSEERTDQLNSGVSPAAEVRRQDAYTKRITAANREELNPPARKEEELTEIARTPAVEKEPSLDKDESTLEHDSAPDPFEPSPRARHFLYNNGSFTEPGVEEIDGEREKIFHQYIVQLHEEFIHPLFADTYLRSLNELSWKNPLNNQSIRSHLEIEVLSTGQIGEIRVVMPSGVREFDAAAIETVLKAAPFPQTPREIRSWNDSVYMRWGFYRNLRKCGLMNIEPFIVKRPKRYRRL